MGDEEKRAIAMATLLGLGIGAAYILKDELKDKEEDKIEEKKEEIVEEPPQQIMRDVEKEEEEKVNVDVIPGKEVHALTWDYFRRWLGGIVPSMDMVYIYPLLPEDFKNQWRRGIYNYGVNTSPDKTFVYYDSYYLSQRGYRDLERVFKKYAYNHGSFESLFEEYRKVIKEILTGAKV